MKLQSLGPVLVALVPLALVGCEAKSACVKKGVVVAVAGGHPHEVSIPTEHVSQTTARTYAVKGPANHAHVVHLTGADMEKLKAGTPVETRTSSVNAHVHEVTVSCKQ